MKITRAWAMPNKNTFSIKPIAELIERYLNTTDGFWIDPFVGENPYAMYSNDMNPNVKADRHLDAIDFLRQTPQQNDYCMFFDPPYSPRQSSECYKSVGKEVNMQTTQSSWWANLKDEIARLVAPNHFCITACWNSNGIGMSRGFQIEEILIVAHGGWHNDTIVTVERKVQNQIT
jgi:hypothetical protein